ncbi:HIT family protein [Cohnella yongneupensis]|uniref:HIT family protein n=1 Tax=Cohnella yongneupensis TaxID=425006 RepID=A0ABW0R2U6_9BACL
MDCFICRKHLGETVVPGGLVYEDDHVYIGHRAFGEEPGYLGYFMIDAKRHAEGLGALTDEESAAVGMWTNRISQALKTMTSAEHVYAFVHGEAVAHFHMHIVPRYPGTPDTYRNPMMAALSPEAPRGDSEQIEALCARIRGYVARYFL